MLLGFAQRFLWRAPSRQQWRLRGGWALKMVAASAACKVRHLLRRTWALVAGRGAANIGSEGGNKQIASQHPIWDSLFVSYNTICGVVFPELCKLSNAHSGLAC